MDALEYNAHHVRRVLMNNPLVATAKPFSLEDLAVIARDALIKEMNAAIRRAITELINKGELTSSDHFTYQMGGAD